MAAVTCRNIVLSLIEIFIDNNECIQRHLSVRIFSLLAKNYK